MQSALFSKSMLRLGTYHSPDGTVVVTPGRLRHWEQQFRRLRDANLAVPSHFDHSAKSKDMLPIPVEELRSAKNTVGHLRDFKVAPDGKSAEVVIETLRDDAKAAVASNSVFLSPVIFPEFKDGRGNTYGDVITSFDLVDHPVDHSQSTFSPLVRMGRKVVQLGGLRMSLLKNRGPKARQIRMGLDDMEPDDKKKKPDMGAPSDAADSAGDDSAPDDADMGPGDGSASDDTDSDSATDEGNDLPDGSEEDAYDKVDQVLDLLKEFGVHLPDDTDDSTLIKHLRVALTALLQGGAKAGMDQGGAAQDSTQTGDSMLQVNPPQMATMSLQRDRATAYAEKLYKAEVHRKLREHFESGRCTPADFDRQKRLLGTVRLSLNEQGEPVASAVEAWLEARESIPAGACYKLSNAGKPAGENPNLQAVPAPTEWAPPSKILNSDEHQKAVAILMRR